MAGPQQAQADPWAQYTEKAPPSGKDPWAQYVQPQPSTEKPGVLSTLWSNIKSIPSSLAEPDPMVTLPWQKGLSDQEKDKLVTQQEDEAAATNARRSQMHGPAYSLTSSGLEMIGVPVSSMEQHAEEGNERAIVGDALTWPTLVGAGELGGRVIPKAASPVVRGIARTGEDVLNSKLNPFKTVANLNVPADEASALKIKVPGRNFGLSIAKPGAVDPALTSPSRTLPGQVGREVIRPPASPIPSRSGLALPPGPEPAAGQMVRSIARPSAAPTSEPLPVNATPEEAANNARFIQARQQPGAIREAPNALNDKMTPQEKEIWQERMFGQKPTEDIGTKVREANPEPPRATTRVAKPSATPDISTRLAQTMEDLQNAPSIEPQPEGRPLMIDGKIVDPTQDLTAGLKKSLRRVAKPSKSVQ